MKQWVIHKTSRAPNSVSYSGPTWNSAGISFMHRDFYTDLDAANEIARLLTQANPVGFKVSPRPKE